MFDVCVCREVGVFVGFMRVVTDVCRSGGGKSPGHGPHVLV